MIKKKSLEEVNPEAAKMWDTEENDKRGLLPPNVISAGSNKRAQFICLDNPEHIFDSKICDMTDRDGNSRGCKICRQPNKSFVSFFDYCPEAKSFWDYGKNNIDPTKVSRYSVQNAFFKCEKGHSFVKSISEFTQAPSCPLCKPSLATEKPELLVFWDYPKNKDINPYKITAFSGEEIFWKCPSCGHKWRLSPLKINQTSKDKCPKCGYREKIRYGTSFRDFNPSAAELWDYKQNGSLTPDNTPFDSNSYVYLQCPNNPNHSTHIKVSTIPHFPPFGCIYCTTPEIKKKYSFAALFPELLNEYSTNNKLDPYSLSEISQDKVEWYCKKHNYLWKASPFERTRDMVKCKYCTKEKTTVFSQLHPYLEKYYDSSKNDIPYEKVTETGNPVFWWKCEKGHSFPYHITNFSRKGKFDCPVCKGRIAIEGQTDLLSQYPKLAQEYDVEANRKTPNKVSIFNTNSNTHWICKRGHIFKMAVYRRIQNNGVCYKCLNEKVNSTNTHFNIDNKSSSNLLDMYPNLEPFWDYTKNKQSPKEYSSLHDELIYALCPNKKHDGFQVTITAIIKNKYRCLACEDKILVPGFNSLADRHPEWLQEWDYISNNALKIYPERILTNYSKEVWWVCKDCGYKFKMAPNKYRDFDLRGKTKCLYCKGKRRKRKYFG